MIELIVIIGVVSVVTGAAVVSVGNSGQQGRDLERQSALRELQVAIEAYHRDNGQYPAMGCGGQASESVCSTYIDGLWPQYMNSLPSDPRRSSAAGYTYVTNSERSSYKIMALGTVESGPASVDSEFAACDMSVDMCAGICDTASGAFQSTYSLRGGFADGSDRAAVLDNTRAVACSLVMPSGAVTPDPSPSPSPTPAPNPCEGLSGIALWFCQLFN